MELSQEGYNVKNFNAVDLLNEYKSNLESLYSSGFNKGFLMKYQKGSIRTCEAQLLYSIIRKNGYSSIVDIGTGSGFSALYMAKALKDSGGGKVTTIDSENRNLEFSLSEIYKTFEVDSIVDFIVGDSAVVVPQLDMKIDFALIDGFHSYDYAKKDFENCYEKLNSGGCIALHDVYKKPAGTIGPVDFANEVAGSGKYGGNIYFIGDDVFDFFFYPEDVKDANRVLEKWSSYNFSYASRDANPKQFMAIFFKS